MAIDDDTIQWVFHWYRQRAANIDALEQATPPSAGPAVMASFEPDQQILLAAGLDALANSWSKTFPPAQKRRDRQRMGDFLERHGGKVFWRVAAPIAHREALGKRPEWASAIAEATKLDVLPGRVRLASEDPDVAALAAEATIVGAGISRDWLSSFRYGEVLYEQFRCYWLHELMPAPKTTSVPMPMFADQIHYIDTIESEEATDWYSSLVLPLPFLITTYHSAIESFEKECLAKHVIPKR